MRYCTRCGAAYTAHLAYCSIDGGALAEGNVDPLIGRSIDRYRVEQSLGQGGMGCVYRVAHLVLEHEYAMKVLYGDVASDMRVVERFRLEAKSISRMRHPNIVSVTDFGVSPEGLTFLVMELLHGRTLATIIEQEAPMRPARVIELALQIAAGLEEAHKLELVHRDVKPSNIMIERAGDVETVKLLDFGIVAVTENTSPEDKITTTDRCLGTPHYMSPEQIFGHSTLGPSADLYSLGVVLYEMLTGKVPFDGAASMEVFIGHLTQAAPELPPSGGLEMLVKWLMEKHAVKRPQTAREVIAELERIRPAISDLPAAPRTSPDDDTIELFVGDEPGLSAAAEQIRAAVEPPPDPSVRFEAPITWPESVTQAAPTPPGSPPGGVAFVGYEVLREKMDRVLGHVGHMRQTLGDPGRIGELAKRCEEIGAAIRPGLSPYRYTDLAVKIAKLEDELRTLRA